MIKTWHIRRNLAKHNTHSSRKQREIAAKCGKGIFRLKEKTICIFPWI
jgi:hypothetical protein